MSDSCPEPEFESIGTIHYRVSGTESSLFFVPDPNHFLEYSGTSYAVFISNKEDVVRQARAVTLRDSGIFLKKAVAIKLQSCDKMSDVLPFLLQAAQNQTPVTVTVTVTVEKPESYVVKLVGITFPAR